MVSLQKINKMNHIVSSCKDCSLLNTDYGDGMPFSCNHPTLENINIEQDNLRQPICPDNCPLKKDNLTIVFDDKS